MGYSFLKLAKDVLEFEGIPLNVEEIWRSAERNQLLEQLGSSGKTPIRTLSAQIYDNIIILKGTAHQRAYSTYEVRK